MGAEKEICEHHTLPTLDSERTQMRWCQLTCIGTLDSGTALSSSFQQLADCADGIAAGEQEV